MKTHIISGGDWEKIDTTNLGNISIVSDADVLLSYIPKDDNKFNVVLSQNTPINLRAIKYIRVKGVSGNTITIFGNAQMQGGGGSGTLVFNGSKLGVRDPTETYNPNDGVLYDGNIYISLTTNTNSQPDINPTDWVLYPKPKEYTTTTDPATDTALTTSIVDTYAGIIITTTAAGNNQTFQNPSSTNAGTDFTVVNNDTSTDSFVVNTGSKSTVIEPGEAQRYVRDGTDWILVESVDASDITAIPFDDITGTNVQLQLEQVNSKINTASLYQPVTVGTGGMFLTVESAIAAGYHNLLIISDVIESDTGVNYGAGTLKITGVVDGGNYTINIGSNSFGINIELYLENINIEASGGMLNDTTTLLKFNNVGLYTTGASLLIPINTIGSILKNIYIKLPNLSSRGKISFNCDVYNLTILGLGSLAGDESGVDIINANVYGLILIGTFQTHPSWSGNDRAIRIINGTIFGARREGNTGAIELRDYATVVGGNDKDGKGLEIKASNISTPICIKDCRVVYTAIGVKGPIYFDNVIYEYTYFYYKNPIISNSVITTDNIRNIKADNCEFTQTFTTYDTYNYHITNSKFNDGFTLESDNGYFSGNTIGDTSGGTKTITVNGDNNIITQNFMEADYVDNGADNDFFINKLL